MSNPGIQALMGQEDPTAGAEAAAQSQVAQKGLEAWKRVQTLGGARPEMDDLKALLMYVLTEGMAAPQAAEIAAYLKDKGVNIPGVSADPSGLPPDMPSEEMGEGMPDMETGKGEP